MDGERVASDLACGSEEEEEVAAASDAVDVVHPPKVEVQKAALARIATTNRRGVSGGTGIIPQLGVILRVAVTTLHFPIEMESGGGVAEAACLEGGGGGGESIHILATRHQRGDVEVK